MEPDISLHQQEIDRYPLKEYFNIEGRAAELDGDFDFILGWAQERGIKTPEDLKLELRKMESRLGTASIHESRITKVKNYLKTDAKLTALLKDMASQEQGWGNMR